MTLLEALDWLNFLKEEEHIKADSIVPCDSEIAIGMAIESLKQQQNNIIQYDQLFQYNVAWLEIRGENTVLPVILDESGLMWNPECNMDKMYIPVADEKEYGAMCRCWTRKPTDEERKEAAWDD